MTNPAPASSCGEHDPEETASDGRSAGHRPRYPAAAWWAVSGSAPSRTAPSRGEVARCVGDAGRAWSWRGWSSQARQHDQRERLPRRGLRRCPSARRTRRSALGGACLLAQLHVELVESAAYRAGPVRIGVERRTRSLLAQLSAGPPGRGARRSCRRRHVARRPACRTAASTGPASVHRGTDDVGVARFGVTRGNPAERLDLAGLHRVELGVDATW